MKLSDALVLALKDFGVRHVFGVSGANIEHVHDAINRLGQGQIVSVMAKCESGAAFMADCHARVHRRLAVCCATSGGGMVNLLAGIAESYAESVPVLAIVGQAPTALEGKGAFQDSSGKNHSVRGEQLWQSVSKYVGKLAQPSDFWPKLREAIVSALHDRPGPSVLLIPRDFYDQEVDAPPDNWASELKTSTQNKSPSIDDVKAFMDLLKAAKSPVLIVGHGVKRSQEKSSVVQFARNSGMALATTLSARGEYPNDLPNYLGSVGVAGHPSAHAYIDQRADLLIVVGSGLGIMNRGPLGPMIEKKTTLFVNIDTRPISASFPNARIFVADAGEFFSELNRLWSLSGRQFEIAKDYRRQLYRPEFAKPISERDTNNLDRESLLQSEAIALIEGILPRNGHLVFDAGNCAAAAMHYADVPPGSSSTIALGMGGMGYAIGGAVGAQIGSAPHVRTIAFVGDGAFLMSGLEVHTAVDLALPILYVVFNNNMHGMCVTRQQLFFGGRIECASYSDVDIAQVARGLGPRNRLWVGRAGTRRELESCLEEYREQRHLPGVLELVLRREEVPPFVPFLPKNAPTMDWDQTFYRTLLRE